jgi:hypothetical protein
MGLFLVLFWSARVVGKAFPDNSRFGEFNSRLGPNKFLFIQLRGFSSKALIWLTVFADKTAKIGEIPVSREKSGIWPPPWEWSRLLMVLT